jgi:hypothetical protein
MIAHIFFRRPLKSELEVITTANQPSTTIHTLIIYKDYFNGIPCNFIDYDSVKKKVNREFFEKIIAFGEIKIDGIPIADRLTIDGQSFWHYHKFRSYFYLRELLYEVETIISLFNNYTSIVLYTNKSGISEDLFLPSQEVKVKVNITNTPKFKKNFSSQLKYLLYIALRFVIGIFSRKPKGKHIIIDKGIKQLCINPISFEIGLENIFFENVFRNAGKSITIVSDTEIPPLGSVFSLRNKIFSKTKRNNNSFQGEYVIARALFSIRVWSATLAAKGLLKKQTSYISKEINNPNDKLIINFISSNISSSTVYAFKHKAWKRFFKKWPALSLTSVDENSPMVMSIMDAARFHNIKCIGVQHGSIHSLHPAYIRTKTDVERNVFPSLTLVWGNYWKEFLVNVGNYPSERVLITGQQRTDAIPILLENKDRLKSLLGFDNKKVILFASQPQQDASLRYRAAQDVFSAAKKQNQFLFVVKLHPSELNDSKYYHSIAKEVGCSNYRIDESADLYAMLAISEIVITCFSTVGSEALYFKKPIIILDHLKADLLGLIGKNLALRATNAEEVSVAIDEIINGKETALSNTIETYVYEYALKIDGLASQRILNAIIN